MSAAEDDCMMFQFSPEMTRISCDEKNTTTNKITDQYVPYTLPVWIDNAVTVPKPRVAQPQEVMHERQLKLQELIEQRRKLEEMADRYWIREGEISESMFESSSDEEGV